jgi:hypothetical protein
MQGLGWGGVGSECSGNACFRAWHELAVTAGTAHGSWVRTAAVWWLQLRALCLRLWLLDTVDHSSLNESCVE